MDPLKSLAKELMKGAYRDQKRLAMELQHQIDALIESESHKIYRVLSCEFNLFQRDMSDAIEAVVNKISELPLEERRKIVRNLGQIGNRFNQNRAKGGVYKDIFEISDETMQFVYDVAHTYLQNNEDVLSEAVFAWLCFLNPLRADHWVGYGCALRGQNKMAEALSASAMGTMVDIDHPLPRIQMITLHLDLGDFIAAKMEFEELERIVQDKHLQSMEEDMTEIRNYIHQNIGMSK